MGITVRPVPAGPCTVAALQSRAATPEATHVPQLFRRTRRPASPHPGPERRLGADRRASVLKALLYGGLCPRRQGPRRAGEHRLGAFDWHHPWWLLLAILILLLSCTDAALTLVLIGRGAFEVNPLLAPLVRDSPAFILVKVGLTGVGIVCLTLLARVKAFGRLPARALFYAALIGYVVLIAYELKLLTLL